MRPSSGVLMAHGAAYSSVPGDGLVRLFLISLVIVILVFGVLNGRGEDVYMEKSRV